MPFTPFHMGPGCALKALAGNAFSLTVFGFTQVAMDVQPLILLVRGEANVHGFSHTYVGATLVAIFSVFLGRPVCQVLLSFWKPRPDERLMTWLRGPAVISWPAAISGAFIGAFSHVFLDSAIHFDVRPFVPFADGNPLQGSVSFAAMHFLCLGIGVLGVIGFLIRFIVDTRP